MIKYQPNIFYVLGSLCSLCELNRASETLCQPCLSNLLRPSHTCFACAESLNSFMSDANLLGSCPPATNPSDDLHTALRSLLCGQCLSSPPLFERTVTALAYNHPCDYLLNNFKQQRNLNYGKWLSKQLTLQIQCQYQNQDLPTALVPTPSYSHRLIKRGFNPAHFIARELSKALQLPLINALTQTRKSADQKALDRNARLKNLKHCFDLVKKRQKDIQGQHIALVDDVMTTGATANTLTRHLQRAGAKRVDVWLLARTHAK